MKPNFRAIVTDIALFCAKRARIALFLSLTVSALSLLLVAQNLKFNSDKESLVAETATFKQRNARFDAAFPQFANSLLVVVDGTHAAEVFDVAKRVAGRLALEPNHFRNIFLAEGDPFFEENGLLFLSVDELEDRVNRFAEAEPALATIAADPSLRGVIELLTLGLNAVGDKKELPSSFATFSTDFLDTAEAISRGDTSQHLEPVIDSYDLKTRYILTLQPTLDYASQSAERASVQHLRSILAEHAFAAENVRIRLTGRVALADDEISAIQDSVFLSGFLSVAFAGALLGFALRSIRLISAILITLFVGLSWTMGFATLSVGSLNMISAAVVILFIGLGIDHAIHVSLRYREARQSGQSHLDGIKTAAQEMGGAVALCATTSAIGFAAFVPTQYQGLAELGIIAAGSLFLAFIASFTVLPALLTLMGEDKSNTHVPHFVGLGISNWLTGHSMRVSLLVAVAALFSLTLTGAPTFDFSTLTIRDASSQSVTTLVELQNDGVVTDYAADILVDTPEEAEDVARRLMALPQVSEVITPQSFVPQEQALKLDILADAEGFLWTALNTELRPAPSEQERINAVRHFASLTSGLTGHDPVSKTLQQIGTHLNSMLDAPNHSTQLADLEQEVVAPLKRDLERLRIALGTRGVRFEDLPIALQERYIGKDGELRVTAISSEPLMATAALQNFVEAIRSVAPDATGRALTEADVGALVIRSFYLAGLIAFCGIAVLLLTVLRSPVDAALVLAPLGMAACFTIASATLLGISFNFANIVVLPLIFGLGVDSGIHFVLRRRHEKTVGTVMLSSTPQAIMLSALSTIGAFSALSLSRHWGMASMGLLLTIAVFWVIVCTIIVLPALMAWRDDIRAA
jgi:uncharacterized protein